MPIKDQISQLFSRAVSWTQAVPPPPELEQAARPDSPPPSLLQRAVSWVRNTPPPEPIREAALSSRDAFDALTTPTGASDRADQEALELGRQTRRQDGSASLAMLIAHTEQFATKWGAGINTYWSRFDEALRDNWMNALAMRRSAFIEELMNARKLPLATMEWHISVDDDKDDDQRRAQERIHKALDTIPVFSSMRYYLGEDKWQGKAGSQLQWDFSQIDGNPFITVVNHEPVDGDSIVYGYDKVPGILVRSGWQPTNPIDEKHIINPKHEWIRSTDRARALFLYDQFWRDHFVISNFNPRSADYLYEGDKAAMIFGLGYRGMLYWDWQLREELRSWLIDALQRIGVNGMLYGFFESGNVAMMNEVISALKLMIRDNVTAFPYLKGQVPQMIQHIEPSAVGYEVLAHWVDILEQTMRRCVLGQSLSSMTGATGMGSEVAKLHEQTMAWVTRADAMAQQEVITRDIIGPMVRFNTWQWRGQEIKGYLPFRLRFVYSFDKPDAIERAQIINTLATLGVPMSLEQIYSDTGCAPPKSAEDTLKTPQQGQPGQGMPGQGQPPGQNGNGDDKAGLHDAIGAGVSRGRSGIPKRIHVHRDESGRLQVKKPGFTQVPRTNGLPS